MNQQYVLFFSWIVIILLNVQVGHSQSCKATYEAALTSQNSAELRLQKINDYLSNPKCKEKRIEAFLEKGKLQHELEQFENAMESYNAAINMDSNYGNAYLYRGLLKRQLGYMDSAKDDFEKAVNLMPGNELIWIAYQALGELYHKKEQYLKAITAFDEARAKCTKEYASLVHLARAETYVALENYDKAFQDIDRVLTENKNIAKAHFLKGIILQRLDRCKEALKYFAEGEQLDTTYTKHLNSKQLCLLPNSPSKDTINNIGQKRLALLIGNSDYSTLGNLFDIPYQDVALLKDRFERLGFKTIILQDLNKGDFEKAIDDFQQKIWNERPDIVAVYYSGHGIEESNENYLIPLVEKKFTSKADFDNYAIKLNWLVQKTCEGNASVNLFFVDACRNTANIRSIKTTNNNGIRSVSLPNSVQGTLIAYATVSGNTANNGENLGNSPYALALAKYLNGKKSIADILSEVNSEVKSLTNGEQQTEFVSRLEGTLILNNE